MARRASQMAAMRPLLAPDQRSAVDQAVAAIKPLEKSMKALQRKLNQASARENQARISGDDAALQKQKDEFDSLDQQYQDLRDQLAAASMPATAGATATGSASATAGAPASP
jgi:phage shock protein A